MLSSFIFTYVAVNHTNLPQNQKLSFRLKKTRFRTQSQGGCHILHPQQWCYTNLTNYEFAWTILMQLSRNSSHKPGTNLSGVFILILTYYYMVFKVALF